MTMYVSKKIKAIEAKTLILLCILCIHQLHSGLSYKSILDTESDNTQQNAVSTKSTDLLKLSKSCTTKNLSVCLEQLIKESSQLPQAAQANIASLVIDESKGLHNVLSTCFRPLSIAKFDSQLAAATLSSDGSKLLVSNKNGTIKAYDPFDHEKPLQEFVITQGNAAPAVLSINNKGTRGLATNQGADEVVIFDPQSGNIDLIQKARCGFCTARLSQDGSKAITKEKDGSLEIIDLSNLADLKSLHDLKKTSLPSNKLSEVELSGNGQRAIVGSKVVDAATGKEIIHMDGNEGPGFSIASNHDGSLIVYHDGTPCIKAFDLINQKRETIRLPYTPTLVALNEHAKIAGASYYNTQTQKYVVELIDLETGALLARMNCPAAPFSITFSHNNLMLVGYPVYAELFTIKPIVEYQKLCHTLNPAQATLLSCWHRQGNKPLEIKEDITASIMSSLPAQLKAQMVKRHPTTVQKQNNSQKVRRVAQKFGRPSTS